MCCLYIACLQCVIFNVILRFPVKACLIGVWCCLGVCLWCTDIMRRCFSSVRPDKATESRDRKFWCGNDPHFTMIYHYFINQVCFICVFYWLICMNVILNIYHAHVFLLYIMFVINIMLL